jgi:hypothetical protein
MNNLSMLLKETLTLADLFHYTGTNEIKKNEDKHENGDKTT